MAVANQEAETRRLLLDRPDELARLLGDPLSARVGGAAGEVNAAALQFDEEENAEPVERDRLDGEEVDREHAVGLLAQERPPGRAGTLAGRTNPRIAEDLPDRGC